MSNARISGLAARIVCALQTLLTTLCALLITNAHAANETITWGFSPTPVSVSIKVGETVTWNGDLNFHPLIVTNASFATIGATVSQGGTTYARGFSVPGTYYFMCGAHGSSMPTTVTVSCGTPPVTLATLDIDGNGQVDAATDGLLVLRYLLGMRGQALVAGAVGICPSRDTTAIENYLAARVLP